MGHAFECICKKATLAPFAISLSSTIRFDEQKDRIMVTDTARSAEFDIVIEKENDAESLYLAGPFWPTLLKATREESTLIVEHIRQCAGHAGHFGLRLASGDCFSISRWDGQVLLQFYQARNFLPPEQALILSDAISEAWSNPPGTTSFA
jgi:hypothetical protein